MALDGIQMPAGRRTSCAWITAPNAIGSVRSCDLSSWYSLGKSFRYLKQSLECTWAAVRVASHSILETASAAIESDQLASTAGCHHRIRNAEFVERQQFSHGYARRRHRIRRT